MKTRRQFLHGAAAAATLPYAAGASGKKIRIGVVGGGFGCSFYWHEHPNCEVVAATDLYAGRRERLRETFRCDSVYNSLDEMLRGKAKELDAVAVFSGAPDHVDHAVQCFERGLHVISAVPACMNLEDAARLKEAKERTGLRYMMAETSYYRPGCIHVRELFEQGGMGDIFYSEVEYYHDGDRLGMVNDKTTRYYNPDGTVSWRQALPPMLYPTHSLGFVVGVTRERIVSVSSLGWSNPELTNAFKANPYDNRFSNEFASMKTNRGNMVRCNVFWQAAAEGERAQWFGEKGSFYMPKRGFHPAMWHPRHGDPEEYDLPEYFKTDRLPAAMRHSSGHGGSHVFLTAEFVSALVEDREPVIDVYEALAMTVPGIVAHQSSRRDGEQLTVPQFDRG